MSYIVGVDIGGTKVNFVLLKNLRVVKTRNIATPKTKKKLIEELQKNIQELLTSIPKSKIAGIGIGHPGPSHPQGKTVLNPPQLKYLHYCPLGKIIQKHFKIKTVIDNDIHSFGLGEALLGAGRGSKNVFGLTLGTGVGAGMIIDNKFYRGSFGAAGEVGHMTLIPDGFKCLCGSYGCFEQYCSKRFFKRKNLSPESLAEKAKKGDKKAIKIYNEFGRFLGIGLSNVINILDPEVIVIGGGIANAYPLFIKAVKQEIKKRVISPIAKKNVKIRKAELGDFAGAIGAALLVQQK